MLSYGLSLLSDSNKMFHSENKCICGDLSYIYENAVDSSGAVRFPNEITTVRLALYVYRACHKRRGIPCPPHTHFYQPTPPFPLTLVNVYYTSNRSSNAYICVCVSLFYTYRLASVCFNYIFSLCTFIHTCMHTSLNMLVPEKSNIVFPQFLK